MVDIEDEEIPTEEDVTFMLEPALSTTASGPSGMDEALVIFCVDISGSMCVTTEVCMNTLFEPLHEKTRFLHIRKQSRRSAVR